MDSHQHQSSQKKTESQPTPQDNESTPAIPGGLLLKAWDDPRLPRLQRQHAIRQMSAVVGNRSLNHLLQRVRSRHPGVFDNGTLNRNVPVVLGELSGILPQGTYVEVIGYPGTDMRVKVWSGYGGQETTIPATAFQQGQQRHDHLMDRADMGAYAQIPADQRLPFMPSASLSHQPERHDGVVGNGRLRNSVFPVTLGGQTGRLPANTYIEILNSPNAHERNVRVWSGFGGQTTKISPWVPANFVPGQVADHLMDVPDLAAYGDIEVNERLPLADSVRLQVIDNGVLTQDVTPAGAGLPVIPSGTYVEVMEQRGTVVVLRPNSAWAGLAGERNRFVSVPAAVFTAAFRHQPQLSDQSDSHHRPILGTPNQGLEYRLYPPPNLGAIPIVPGYLLWGSSGPQLEDIRQGEIGTCGILATLGAILRQDPTIITNRVLMGNSPTANTFTVHLFQAPTPHSAAGSGYTPVTRTIDRYLPQYIGASENTESAYASGRRALWPAVIEKAYAEILRGYDNIDQGQWEAVAMSILTGDSTGSVHNPHRITHTGIPPASLLSQLQDLERRRAAVTFMVSGNVPALHLIGPHAYVFTHLEGETAVLANPWRNNQPLALTMPQVQQHVSVITVRE